RGGPVEDLGHGGPGLLGGQVVAGRQHPQHRGPPCEGHRGRLRRPAPLADDAPALTLGRPSPHALLLAHGQGVLETGFTYGTLCAHVLGVLGLLLGDRVEDERVEPAAGSVLAPGLLHGGGKISLSDVRGDRGRRPAPHGQPANRSLRSPGGRAKTRTQRSDRTGPLPEDGRSWHPLAAVARTYRPRSRPARGGSRTAVAVPG